MATREASRSPVSSICVALRVSATITCLLAAIAANLYAANRDLQTKCTILKSEMQRRVLALLYAFPFLTAAAAEPTDTCEQASISKPVFGTAKVNVREAGAKADGRSNDTAAINKAIDECHKSGGGDVVFPAGTYSAASIHLNSNVRFVLDKDAIITGAKSGYDPPEPNAFERFQDFGHSHFHNALMWGENIENFAIVGGRINGGEIVEDEAKDRNAGDKVIALRSSRNLLLENVTHETGGHFFYLLNDCGNVMLTNVTIRKSRDAVNLVGCRNVQVHQCNFTGCGDRSEERRVG